MGARCALGKIPNLSKFDPQVQYAKEYTNNLRSEAGKARHIFNHGQLVIVFVVFNG